MYAYNSLSRLPPRGKQYIYPVLQTLRTPFSGYIYALHQGPSQLECQQYPLKKVFLTDPYKIDGNPHLGKTPAHQLTHETTSRSRDGTSTQSRFIIFRGSLRFHT